MKKSILLYLAFGLMLGTGCQENKTEKEQALIENEITEVPGNYGDEVNSSSVTSTAQMIQIVNETGSFEGKISGEIVEVCTKKGCWLTLDLPNGESMRVTFKDYGFFVPTTSQGFPIILDGVATLTETDVETLRHFAEDQGKSKDEVEAITEPKREITFEATGVIIQEKS
ncbi:DUF4920 domain-containing protein [Algoriphagus halophytocola]|uniref:DUF4920 domain-containing protein n=1 Tax=Algoriphagus halophytocola TaxID=2991499 RepID=A0ABY6MH88_9BACT|nr:MULTISPECIES: DUF4920 domain-containing protein [unclassified Algoriphagus]UZD23150.1 DUF4920 domain-containing protein [Algoriphagus sp. TR-M5]WBL44442.1 DUF4920 domain-containing protein [Algoriphagus sp. TR-M9]